jgi:hypothetical protein
MKWRVEYLGQGNDMPRSRRAGLWLGGGGKACTVLVDVNFKHGERNRIIALRWLRFASKAGFGTKGAKLSASATAMLVLYENG